MMMIKKLCYVLGMAALSAVSTGCSLSTLKADRATEVVAADVNEVLGGAQEFAKTRRQRVRMEDVPYVDTTRVAIEEGLPPVFFEEVGGNVPNVVPMAYAIERLTMWTGYRVRIQEDVYAFFKRQSVEENGGVAQQSSQQSASRFTGGTNTIGTDIFVDLSFQGTNAALLDRIAAALSASWEYNAKEKIIELFRYKTVSYKVAGTYVTEAVQATVTNSSTSEAGSSLTTTNNAQLDTYEAITRDITAMLSEEGKLSVQRTLQSVVVTDTPRVQERVADYLARLNRNLQREIYFELKIMTLSLSDTDTRGINFNLLRSTTSGQMSLGTVRDVQGFGTLIGSVLDGAEGSLAAWAGSQIIIDALAQQGEISNVKTISLRALNGTTAPYQNTRRIGYISQSGTVFSGVGNGVGETSRQTDFETVGLTLRVLPHLLEDGQRMMLQLWLTMSELLSLDEKGDGDNLIQIPQIASNDFQQRFGISSGQTLVLASYESMNNDVDHRSMGPNARWWALGGSGSASVTRDVTVFLLTPVVVDGGNSPQA